MSRGTSLSNPKINKYLLEFLSHWLAYHILGQDQNLARQIRSIESGNSPQQAYEAEERLRDHSTKPLLRALNGLFLQISARNKALLSLNKSLKAQVTVRTRELTIANRHLEELASTDMLTGLHNRRHALRRLNRLWLEADTSDRHLVCIMIDADHFKEVNDLYGHDAGDRVLQELAKTLLHGFRSDDVVCRLGGDEFLVFCPDTDSAGDLHIANQILQTVAQLQVPTGDQHWLGSVSIAHRTPNMVHYKDLIKMADLGACPRIENRLRKSPFGPFFHSFSLNKNDYSPQMIDKLASKGLSLATAPILGQAPRRLCCQTSRQKLCSIDHRAGLTRNLLPNQKPPATTIRPQKGPQKALAQAAGSVYYLRWEYPA